MVTQREIEAFFEQVDGGKNKVCVFGTGKLTLDIGYETLRKSGVDIECFFDNDSEKWGKKIVASIICKPISELKKYKSALFVIMISGYRKEDVRTQLLNVGIAEQNILFGEDLLYNDRYVDGRLNFGERDGFIKCFEKETPFYTRKPIENMFGKPIALYYCVSGGYDEPTKPLCLENELIDYYLITDDKNEKETFFHIINLNDVVPEEVTDNARKNRFCKILGSDIFSDYHYSIYLDGSYLIKEALSEYIGIIGDSGIALRKEGDVFDCLYQEGVWAMDHFGNEEMIRQQMYRYYCAGMPRHWGAYACGCLVRDNTNVRLKKAMHVWWDEVFNYSFRDQVSFTYAMWSNQITNSEIGILDGDWRENKELLLKKHKYTNRLK